MEISNVSLSVRVKGKPVAEYSHEGRVFVEGKEGSKYSLRIKNDIPNRVKVVPSIDGINVISGKPATGERDEIGYILSGYQSFDCDGYRLDNNSVASFKFVKSDQSYAKSEKGILGTTGVIGLRVWIEKEELKTQIQIVEKIVEKHYDHYYPEYRPYWPYHRPYYWDGGYWSTINQQNQYSAGSSASSFQCSLNSSARVDNSGLGAGTQSMGAMNCSMVADHGKQFQLGSTFGEKVESRITETTFNPGHLICEMAIYYSTRDGLKSLGVDISRTDKVSFPEAFSGKFCETPKGWTG